MLSIVQDYNTDNEYLIAINIPSHDDFVIFAKNKLADEKYTLLQSVSVDDILKTNTYLDGKYLLVNGNYILYVEKTLTIIPGRFYGGYNKHNVTIIYNWKAIGIKQSEVITINSEPIPIVVDVEPIPIVVNVEPISVVVDVEPIPVVVDVEPIPVVVDTTPVIVDVKPSLIIPRIEPKKEVAVARATVNARKGVRQNRNKKLKYRHS